MRHLRHEQVPIIPTVLVTTEDYRRLGAEGITQLVCEQQREHWGSELQMDKSTLFCKEDGPPLISVMITLD